MFDWSMFSENPAPRIEQLRSELSTMLQDGRHAFDAAADVVLSGGDPESVRASILATDAKINEAERRVRRELVVHGTVFGANALPGILVLMSLVKDAERIGEYAKAVFGVSSNGGSIPASGPPNDTLVELRDRASDHLGRAIELFSNRDEPAATAYLEANDAFQQDCAAAIKALHGEARNASGGSPVDRCVPQRRAACRKRRDVGRHAARQAGFLSRPTRSRAVSAGGDAPGPRSMTVQTIARWCTALIAVHVVWRLVRYGLAFPLWGDEARVAVNLFHRGPLELMQPLEWLQIVPVGFLWIEWAIARIAGTGEFALRAAPAAAGLLGVAMVWRLAARTLDPIRATASVAVFAASYYPVRHATEVKPYSFDLLLASITILLGLEIARNPGARRPCVAFAGFGSAAVWLSYPVAFTIAGSVLAALPSIRTLDTGRVKAAAWIAIAAASPAASFVAMYLLAGRHQAAAGEFLLTLSHWREQFPPIDSPSQLPAWLLDVHTGNLFAYPIGGNNHGSAVTFVLFAVGIGTLIRERRGRLVGIDAVAIRRDVCRRRLLQVPVRWERTHRAAPCTRDLHGLRRRSPHRDREAAALSTRGNARVVRSDARHLDRWNRAHSGEAAQAPIGTGVARATVEAMGEDTQPGDHWIVFAALEPGSDFAPTLPRVVGSKGWGGTFARVQFYLQHHAVGRRLTLSWAPDPADIAMRGGANTRTSTVLIAYHDNTNPFPTERFARYRNAISEALGRNPDHSTRAILQERGPETLELYVWGR